VETALNSRIHVRRTETEILEEMVNEVVKTYGDILIRHGDLLDFTLRRVAILEALVKEQGCAIAALEARVGSYKVEDAPDTQSDMPSPEHTD
jgi:hypothetical protein